MKEIIVGVDFSRSSILAFQYALKVADTLNCALKLVYVSKKRDTDNELIEDEKGMQSSVKESFKRLIRNYGHQIDAPITHKVLQGKIYEEITNQAKYTDASFIITGAHGMSGFEEMWVGNNANKIISHATKPVISVKKNYKIKNVAIEKVVLPIDSTFETLQKIPFTLELAKHFKAQINVLSLYSSKMKDQEERVDHHTQEAMHEVIASGLRYINEKKICDNNITRGTIEYALKRNADLISIMTEQEFSSQNVLLGTYAQQMVNQSPLPVLSHRTRVIVPRNRILE